MNKKTPLAGERGFYFRAMERDLLLLLGLLFGIEGFVASTRGAHGAVFVIALVFTPPFHIARHIRLGVVVGADVIAVFGEQVIYVFLARFAFAAARLITATLTTAGGAVVLVGGGEFGQACENGATGLVPFGQG